MQRQRAARADFRDRARGAAEPVARVFGRLGLSPNALTLIGFGFAVAAAASAGAQAWLLAGVLVAVGAAFDMLDGALARATNRLSRLGSFLDSTIDRAGEAVVYVGVALGCLSADFRAGALLSTTAMAAAFMVSYSRAKAESLGFGSGRGLASVGFGPREVRVPILVVGLVLTDLWGGAEVGRPLPGPLPPDPLGTPWLALALGLITVLATMTTIQRIVHVYQQAKKEQ